MNLVDRQIFLIQNHAYLQGVDLLQNLVEKLDLPAPILFFSNQTKDEFNQTQNQLKDIKTPRQFLHLNSNNVNSYLGTNQNSIIFDAFCGLDVNSLLLLAGCIASGGNLIFLAPTNWQNKADADAQKIACFPYSYKELSTNFLQFIEANLEKSPHIKIQNLQDIENINAKAFLANKSNLNAKAVFALNTEQEQINKNLLDLFNGKIHSIFLTGIRGSGKTSTAAFSLTQYMQQAENKSIVLIADNKKIAENFLQKITDFVQNKNNNKLKFLAPDASLPANIDILIIEEAGNFNAKQLTTWLQKAKSVLFISTQDGYEGSNNALKVNIQHKVDKILNLSQSYRFSETDPINLWLDASFFIENIYAEKQNLAKTPSAFLPIDKKQIEHKKLDANYLLNNLDDFKQIYNLLRTAHYRTRPSDIRQILDGPNVQLYASFYQNKVMAVALCLVEGNLADELLLDIQKGKRRVQGHLIAQSLALHLKDAQWAKHKYLRISRIAVQEEFRRDKIATQLLEFIEQKNQHNFYALATSFAGKTENIAFWHANNFEIVKIGEKIEKTTGLNSYQMLKVLTTDLK